MGLDGGGHTGKFSLEIQKVQAMGGREFQNLILNWALKLSPLRPYSPPQNPVHPLTWMFLSGEFCSPEQRAVANFRDEVNVHADANPSPERQFRLEIPVDLITIARIEQSREGDPPPPLNLQAFFALHI